MASLPPILPPKARAVSPPPVSLDTTTIAELAFDVSREPLRKPIGFKGAEFREKWVNRVTLTGATGASATAYGGLAVLWSDERVFLGHTETGANLLMASITEFAAQLARGVPFHSPLELHERVFAEVHEYARNVTRVHDLHPTFTLNALVALDHAAWLLHAAERRVTNFDDMVRGDFDGLLTERHATLGVIPLLSYTTTADEVVQLVDDGHFFLKVKIGAAGDEHRMLDTDKKRLLELFRLVGHRETPHTADGRIRFYLDANGRYRRREHVESLLDFADEHGILPQIALFEEPFHESVEADVHGLPVMFAADESLHCVDDVAARWDAGYRAIALKPAGKGLSTTLRMAREAFRLGASCFVADSACTPILLDWNKNVAARVPALAGLDCGVMEANGAQQYARWDEMLSSHPAAARPWIRPVDGAFHFDASFFAGGGLFNS